jgi:phosphate transport system permease protein
MSAQINQPQDAYPDPGGQALKQFIDRRNRSGFIWRIVFQISTIVGIIALTALLYNIINSSFGYVAVQAETTFPAGLETLSKERLVAILEANVSPGLMRRFEAEQPLEERSQEEVYQLVQERVVKPRVVRSWSLVDSIFRRDEIVAAVTTIPNGELEFRSWLTGSFIVSPQSSTPDLAGVRTAILGSLWTIFITIMIALPIGVGAAIYLEEYAASMSTPWLRKVNGIIQTNINNLAGVPSIIYGMLGLAIFVRTLEPITSGTVFGVADPTTANGRTIISAGLTLALLILPLIIINAQEAIRAVPGSLRQASLGLGATKWQTIWHHVLPNALPGILTGNILAISRAIGETAPLVVIGASTFITVDPEGPFSKFTTLPIQIYQWTARPQAEFRNIAAAAIVVLLILLLTLNASAVLLRNRYSRRLI